MYIDAEQQFSDKQNVTATGYSTNNVEIPPSLNSAGLDQAVQVVVRSESGTNPTLTVELETSVDDSTYTKLLGVKHKPGNKFVNIPLKSFPGLKKFLRLRYVVGGTNPAYNLTAMLVASDGFDDFGIQHCAARGQE